MKVYVVTQGQYSDYRVDAIFPTRELAEAYMEHRKGVEGNMADFNEIEERNVWDRIPQRFTVYAASVAIRLNGETDSLKEWSFTRWESDEKGRPGRPVVDDLSATASAHWRGIRATGANPGEVKQAVLDRVARFRAEREGVAV